jgi:hypothetical protein
MKRTINEYDEIKLLLSRARKLTEQVEVRQSIDDTGSEETKPEEKREEFTVSGGKIVVHGYSEEDMQLSDEEKQNFQETMDEFVEQVSDLVDYNALHIYPNNIEWSGKLIKFDLEYFYTLGENSGVYLNGQMMKVDGDFVEMIQKLTNYYKVFSSKWAKLVAARKKTEIGDDDMA